MCGCGTSAPRSGPTVRRLPFSTDSNGIGPSEIALWSGHAAQAEVAVLWPPVPGMVEQYADSRTFAARLRQAAAENTDENSGPMLEFETWSGATPDALGSSQGTIEFDLLGVERAAFPVLDACGA